MINLVYCGNSGIFKGITMSLISAVTSTPDSFHVDILTGDFTSLDPRFSSFSEKQRSFLEKTIQKINPANRISLVDVAPYFNAELASSPNRHSSYTPYTLLRLFMDKIPGLPDKILYLDADTIVLKDLRPLFAVELGKNYLGWVIDAYGRFWISPHYCNAGVLLMNLPELREGKIFEKCLEALRKRHYFFPDQSVLNHFTKGRVLYLPREFNEQKKLFDNTVIRHYCNQPRIFPYVHALVAKPWDIERIHSVYKTTVHDRLYAECAYLWKAIEHE